MAKRLFGVGKPHVRPPRCGTRVLPEDMRQFVVQCAAEVAQRRAIFDASVAKPMF
jgi:hypothetical protein